MFVVAFYFPLNYNFDNLLTEIKLEATLFTPLGLHIEPNKPYKR